MKLILGIASDDYEHHSDRWIIDRFSRQMTVLIFEHESEQQVVVAESGCYATPRLPGFELALGELLRFADRWDTT